MDHSPYEKTCSDCHTCPKVEWSELDWEGIEKVSKNRRTHFYQPGEAIFHQSDAPEGIYCIGHGKVLLCQYDLFGNEIGLGIAYQGETMGWRSFFAEERHNATALALTPCRVCLVPNTLIRGLLKNYPTLPRRFLKTLAKDRGPNETLLLRNPRLTARVRLINLLLLLCNHTYIPGRDGKVSFFLPINRQQIASLIGVRTETLSRILAQLEEEQLAEFDHRQVRVANFDRLLYESKKSQG